MLPLPGVTFFSLRSISSRIALGFLVLLVTFGVVSGYTIVRLRQLGSDLIFVRTAYVEVSLTLAQLVSYESGLIDQLDNPATLRRPMVKRNQELRIQHVEKSLAQLEELGDLPDTYQRAVAGVQERLKRTLDAYHADAPLFDAVLAPDTEAAARADAITQLSNREQSLRSQHNVWFNDLRNDTLRISQSLERVERQATLWAIGLGAMGAILGFLVTIWIVLTLRPLRQLHDGVRSVASGNYRDRVLVTGGTEVADLAREFNAMAAAIEEREQDLVRSERLAAVGKMAAVITHEIRNPLSSIGLNTELLEEDLIRFGVPLEARNLCGAIHAEVDRLAAITEEYLRFARLPKPRLEREQVNGIVAGVIEFQRGELVNEGVRVIAELADGLPLISADEAQLRGAFLNLMRNSVEAMAGTGGVLTVATRKNGASVEIQVRDTGPGIAPDNLTRIFEPFFSTKERGTGLGLALTEQIVAEHGGRIAVDSTLGRGTTFTISLPAAA